MSDKRPDQIQELHRIGQSVWLDYIDRQMLESGELERLRDLGVTGVTANPTIFEKAVTASDVYHEGMRRLLDSGRTPEEVVWDLLIEDVKAAADVLRPVYDEQAGKDGFVSIEVSPEIADDTERTVAGARELHRRCDRPNIMVKIPATLAGIPAIRRMIGEGANINVTLIFSVARYAEVVEAFLSGLEEYRLAGGDLGGVASVASFFVSRVDTKADKALTAAIEQSGDGAVRQRLEALLGKAGIANSKMAYQRFLELHSGPRWDSLAKDGARVQRCLWASTSTKDPRSRDTMYVEELVGPDTVDTMPLATLEALLDHGTVARTLDREVDNGTQEARGAGGRRYRPGAGDRRTGARRGGELREVLPAPHRGDDRIGSRGQALRRNEMPEPSNRLSEDEIADRLRSLSGWEVKEREADQGVQVRRLHGSCQLRQPHRAGCRDGGPPSRPSGRLGTCGRGPLQPRRGRADSQGLQTGVPDRQGLRLAVSGVPAQPCGSDGQSP